MADNAASSVFPLSTPSTAQLLDQECHAVLAKMTSSLSLASAMLSGIDWSVHLAVSPGKRLELASLALKQFQQLLIYTFQLGMHPDTEPHPVPVVDRRFADADWQRWPFGFLHQSFLLTEQWWAAATTGVWGVEKHHANMVAFAARQWLDIFSPGNQLATNPEVLRRTLEEQGANLWRGAINGFVDVIHKTGHVPANSTQDHIVGRDLGISPGKVVFRNHLIELLQYAPTTGAVHPEPVLIVPAWIMKYYILDLSPQRSLIEFLVAQGHTVFCISWKNPGQNERDLGMDNYLEDGFFTAMSVVDSIVPKKRIHAAGYCLGGTLLTIAAAAMARDGDQRLASLTLLAAQTDFAEPGELGLFIDESQVSLLEAQMQEAGSLSAGQMAGAFQMLRSYDLLWSQLVKQYLLGEREQVSDLMAWNSDTTRMPARMHSEYLRCMFLNNDLSNGRYQVNNRPIALNDIDLPIFMVGTESDHVAPWTSVYKLHYLTATDITFVLTSGGHNAGIVSAPGNPRRHFRMKQRFSGQAYTAPQEWCASAPEMAGSWWLPWQSWLAQRSATPQIPPRMGNRKYPVLGDAPGTYVMER
jgi:polyhydroxyalkanoate synthase